MAQAGSVRVGIGGWSFKPWARTFYPPGTAARDELRYASSTLDTIEINGTFYRTQSEPVFAAWRAAVPAGFVFAIKASRGSTASADPERARLSIDRFMASGLHALGNALGPILWQFGPRRRFDPDFFERFVDLLPPASPEHGADGPGLRHAIELRHPSGQDPRLATLLADRGIALALVARPDQPAFFLPGRDFTYLRIEETVDEQEEGLPEAGIALWADRLRAFASGHVPADLADGLIGPPPPPGPREVFAYVIAGAKHRNPALARALAARTGRSPGAPPLDPAKG